MDDLAVNDLWKIFRVARHTHMHQPRLENMARRMMFLKQRGWEPVPVGCGGGGGPVSAPQLPQFGYNSSQFPELDYEQMGEVCLPLFNFTEALGQATPALNPTPDELTYQMNMPSQPALGTGMRRPDLFSINPVPPQPLFGFGQYQYQSGNYHLVLDKAPERNPFENPFERTPASISSLGVSDPFDFNEFESAFTSPVASYVLIPDLAGQSEKKKPKKTRPPTECTNCGTNKTPLWRRNPQGQPLCNACGLFLKLHGVVRPLSLKTDVIKKRQRRKDSVLRSKSLTNIKDLEWLM